MAEDITPDTLLEKLFMLPELNIVTSTEVICPEFDNVPIVPVKLVTADGLPVAVIDPSFITPVTLLLETLTAFDELVIDPAEVMVSVPATKLHTPVVAVLMVPPVLVHCAIDEGCSITSAIAKSVKSHLRFTFSPQWVRVAMFAEQDMYVPAKRSCL
jgi:hypothetical protein